MVSVRPVSTDAVRLRFLVLQPRVQQALKKSGAIVRIDENGIVGHVRARKIGLKGQRARESFLRLVYLPE